MALFKTSHIQIPRIEIRGYKMDRAYGSAITISLRSRLQLKPALSKDVFQGMLK